MLQIHQHLSPGLKQTQKLLLSAAMQQALLVLTLPIMELVPWVEAQIASNPLLEPIEDSFSTPTSSLLLENQEAHPSLFEHLMQQVGMCGFDTHGMEVATSIIGNLDKRGFLSSPLAELCPQEDPKILEFVLKKIQELDPPGIAATSLQESLLIQLKSRNLQNSLGYTMVKDHFDDLLQNRSLLIQKKLKCTFQQIKEAFRQEIVSLDFAPGTRFDHEPMRPIYPDVIVEQEEGKFKITVNEQGIPEFQLSPLYVHYLDKATDAPYIHRHIAAGKWLFRILQRRALILQQITKFLVEKQPLFFLGTQETIQPLTLKEVADQIEVSTSTVGRAITDKHLLYAKGLLPLKTFFSATIKTKEGREISNSAAKKILLRLVTKENKEEPLSDLAIAQKIQSLGIPCARRTVTKYRKELHIPTAQQRKLR